MTTIGLEGGVCAGKSTYAARLVGSHSELRVVPDFMEFVRSGELQDYEGWSADKRAAFFIGLDGRRASTAGDLKASGTTLLDRTFLTVVAYEFARYRMGHASARLSELVTDSSNAILWPQLILFLDVDENERLRRAASTGKSFMFPLLDRPFNNAIREFFRRASSYVPVHFLDSSDRPTLKSIEPMLVSAAQFAEGTKAFLGGLG